MDTFAIYNVSSSLNAKKSNETEDHEDNFLHRDVIYTFVCSVAIIANIFLLFCLLRFEKMRIRRNIIVLNWSMADILHMVANILSFDFLPNISGLCRYDEYYCAVFETRAMLHIATIVFVLWLLLDCTFQQCSRRCFVLTIICVWIIVYLNMITSIALCIYGIYLPYSYASLLVIFGVLIVGVLFYSCLSVKRKLSKMVVEDSKFRFSVVSMYVVCWFANITCFYLSLFLESRMLYNVSKSVAIIGYMNVVINLFLFSFVDRNYGICFANAFKCGESVRNANQKIAYNENADVEFLYTSLKPPSVRNHPKPDKFFESPANIGTPV